MALSYAVCECTLCLVCGSESSLQVRSSVMMGMRAGLAYHSRDTGVRQKGTHPRS